MKEWLVAFLKENNMSITTAESCTGGMIASEIVEVSGASNVFFEGYITYSEEAKAKLLNVSPNTISKYGVVSVEVAAEMAKGAATAAKADVAISTTGVAGPFGGSKENPVGTVCIGCYIKGRIYTPKCHFEGDRQMIRKSATKYAIKYICGLLSQ